jgi:hypothetical protein
MLSLAACGDGSAPEVATAGGQAGQPSASVDVVTAYVEGVRAYVGCLRQEGIEVEDPDATGRFEFVGDLAVLKQDPAFTAAMARCGHLLPPAPAGLDQLPPLTDEQIEAARAYARCMRENGAPDFPDPGPDGYFIDRSDATQSWNQNSAGAREASLICASVIGDPTVPGPGQG